MGVNCLVHDVLPWLNATHAGVHIVHSMVLCDTPVVTQNRTFKVTYSEAMYYRTSSSTTVRWLDAYLTGRSTASYSVRCHFSDSANFGVGLRSLPKSNVSTVDCRCVPDTAAETHSHKRFSNGHSISAARSTSANSTTLCIWKIDCTSRRLWNLEFWLFRFLWAYHYQLVFCRPWRHR